MLAFLYVNYLIFLYILFLFPHSYHWNIHVDLKVINEEEYLLTCLAGAPYFSKNVSALKINKIIKIVKKHLTLSLYSDNLINNLK